MIYLIKHNIKIKIIDNTRTITAVFSCSLAQFCGGSMAHSQAILIIQIYVIKSVFIRFRLQIGFGRPLQEI